MIKSLTLKAEAFNQCRTGSHLDSNTIKEVCFDIQIQLLDFISNSFKDIRHAGMQDAILREVINDPRTADKTEQSQRIKG